MAKNHSLNSRRNNPDNPTHDPRHSHDPKHLFDPRINPFPSIFPLGKSMNPFASQGVEIYPIPLFTAHMPNVKAIVAWKMLEDARSRGSLKGVTTLVEASSGNTLFSLALLAPYYGIKKIVAVVDRDIAPRKREMLALAGVSQFISPEAESETTIDLARRLGKKRGWLNLDQYANPANWKAHYEFSGPYVWKQTGGKISVLSAALGSTGTIVGVGKFLREKNPGVKIVAAACAPDNPVPGARPLSKIQGSFGWKNLADEVVEVERYPAYLASLRLLRAGGMFGPTSGLALAALLSFLEKAAGDAKTASGEKGFDKLRNKDGRVIAAFICGDNLLPYGEKYGTILDGSEFNPISVG